MDSLQATAASLTLIATFALMRDWKLFGWIMGSSGNLAWLTYATTTGQWWLAGLNVILLGISVSGVIRNRSKVS